MPKMSKMFQMRVSKYRHLFGAPSKKVDWYEGIRATTNAHDTNFCEVNPKFFAVVTESIGGGVFLVLPITQTGRLSHTVNTGKVVGHKGAVTDIKWNPFDDNSIASSSDDATVKVWTIPDEGIAEPLEEPTHNLRGHLKRVSRVEWHPLVNGVLLSCALDYRCIVWNVPRGEAVYTISIHRDVIFSMSWSPCGGYFATTCKDKTIRVIDPRRGTVVVQGEGHQGVKSSKVVYVGEGLLFTTGFSRMSERQYALWNTSDLSKPLKSDNVDCSSGILMPYYDKDTSVMFLAGKGDGNIRFYEVSPHPPYIHFLNQYMSNMPQRGLGQMCKRGVDVSRCEIVRFYKLHTNKDLCEPVSMIVPRKSEVFQSDLFPPTNSYHSNISPAEWFNGFDREPEKVDLSFESPPPNNPPKTETRKPTRREELDERLGMTWGGGCRGDVGGSGVTEAKINAENDGVDGGEDKIRGWDRGVLMKNVEEDRVVSGNGVVTRGDVRKGGDDGVVMRKDGGVVRGDLGVRNVGNTSTGPTPKLPASLKNIHRLSTSADFTNLGAPILNHSRDSNSFKSGFYNIGYSNSAKVDEKKLEEQAVEIERLRAELRKKDAHIRRLEGENRRLKMAGKTNKIVEGKMTGVKV